MLSLRSVSTLTVVIAALAVVGWILFAAADPAGLYASPGAPR